MVWPHTASSLEWWWMYEYKNRGYFSLVKYYNLHWYDDDQLGYEQRNSDSIIKTYDLMDWFLELMVI